MLKQIHLYIKGDIIGVGFRAWTRMQAKITGVNGFVRNTDDQVEAVIQGDEKKVKETIEVLKKGMYQNQITDVEVYEEHPKIIFEEFEIRR